MTSNSVEVLNLPKMYRIRPYFEIKKVKLPDCMYLLKPVHQLTSKTATTKEVCSCVLYSLHPVGGCGLDINLNFELKQGTSSSLSYLEKRQEWVLLKIGKLQEKVKTLAENLGIGPAEVGVLQQKVCSI